jgi:N,N'-diacetyllegionaminate synthase
MDNIFIIAEAGVNHNGDLKIAKKLIDAAVNAGANAVKFQTFVAQNLCSRTAPKAGYQKKNTNNKETQFQMLNSLELNKTAHKELISYCKKQNIIFMSSPFDLDSIDLLYSLGIDIFKIPSGEITNLPYLEKIGSLKKKIIMSTGMAELGEVRFAVKILVNSGSSKNDISLLHCCTDYPADFKNVNLRVLNTLTEIFSGFQIGYSDHTTGFEASVAAVAMGAKIIEKHFTLDKLMDGPDHKASIDPEELKGMVCAIRNIEKALGDGIKKSTDAEIKHRAIVRKSIVAIKNIKKGEVFSLANIGIKRPGNGISPTKWYNVQGMSAKKDFVKDEFITI